ncbi:MAG: hypothetical protein J2P17_06935 [Mycobacterium sp.]|nr:hypothetical protein [Mycobacterium sp.]
MPEASDKVPMLDVALGDRAVSQFLRSSLGTLRDGSDDKDFRRLVDDVLRGELSLREAATSDVFERGIVQPFEEGMRQYERLPEAERARRAAEGEAGFARANAEIEERDRRR